MFCNQNKRLKKLEELIDKYQKSNLYHCFTFGHQGREEDAEDIALIDYGENWGSDRYAISSIHICQLCSSYYRAIRTPKKDSIRDQKFISQWKKKNKK